MSRPHSQSILSSHLPDSWEEDQSAIQCRSCNETFSFLKRRHHCRNCGLIYCADCTSNRVVIKDRYHHIPVRVCERCYYALSKSVPEKKPESQLYSQLHAMEDVSKALLVENRDMRSRIENMEAIVEAQEKAIGILKTREAQSDQLIARLRIRSEQHERVLSELARTKSELERATHIIRSLSSSGGTAVLTAMSSGAPAPRHPHHMSNGHLSPLASSPRSSDVSLPIPVSNSRHLSNRRHVQHPFARRGRSVSSSEAELSSAGSSFEDRHYSQHLAALSSSPSFNPKYLLSPTASNGQIK